jgi:glycine cleavage system H protein
MTMAQIPENLRYAKSHEWARLEGETVVVGISDYAQTSLGDVVYVELPEVGEDYDQGAAFGVVESVKATSDIYAPVGGTVLEVNEELGNDPAVVNQDPYGVGWIARFQLRDMADYEALLDPAAYAAHVQEEEAKGGH